MELEYLRINIEDNTDVPIRLSFPVAYEFLETAFNETKLLKRDNSKRHNALIDNCVQSTKDLMKKSQNQLSSAVLLSPISIDFESKTSKR